MYNAIEDRLQHELSLLMDRVAVLEALVFPSRGSIPSAKVWCVTRCNGPDRTRGSPSAGSFTPPWSESGFGQRWTKTSADQCPRVRATAGTSVGAEVISLDSREKLTLSHGVTGLTFARKSSGIPGVRHSIHYPRHQRRLVWWTKEKLSGRTNRRTRDAEAPERDHWHDQRSPEEEDRTDFQIRIRCLGKIGRCIEPIHQEISFASLNAITAGQSGW